MSRVSPGWPTYGRPELAASSGCAFWSSKNGKLLQVCGQPLLVCLCMCDRDRKPQFNSVHFWLLIAAFSLACTTEHAFAADEGRPPAKEQSVSVNVIPPGFPDRITTLEGKTYEKVTLVKVDPDGLLVNFVPIEGGLGSAKLKFRNLAAELRDRFGYDPARASDYESAQARGEAAWRAESAAWTEQRWAAQAEQAAWEREMRAQTESRLAAEAELARVEAVRNVPEPAYDYYPGWWGWSGNYQHHRQGSHRGNNHIRQQMPASIISSPVSPFIGPMRP